jgi:hypothetical protein
VGALPEELQQLGNVAAEYFKILAANSRSLRKEIERLVLLSELWGDLPTREAIAEAQKDGLVPADAHVLLVSARPAYAETQASFPAAAAAALVDVFGPGHVRACEACMNPRVVQDQAGLRYDTGDLAEGSWERCSCGRSAPIVKAIRGRKDDYLIATDGSRMSTVNLYTYFAKLQQIRQFQLRQERPGELRVSFELWGTPDPAARSALAARIANELKTSTRLDVTVDDPAGFVQTGEGKFPAFVQRIGR